ncbi:MAG: Maf family protein [Propioniciclava sp.]
MASSPQLRFVLASASPARLATLRAAGIEPTVHVSGLDESGVRATDPATLALELARLKGEAVLAEINTQVDQVIVACDSVLEVDGRPLGKPGTDAEVRRYWSLLRGRSADLWTGHHVMVSQHGQIRRVTHTARTTVSFAPITDAELTAYIATGEPHQVAGGFTIDGYGSAFIERIAGDPHNVVGISLPLLRILLHQVDVAWPDLWDRTRVGVE